MLRRILTHLASPHRDPEIDRALVRLAVELPGLIWAALIRCDGVLISCFPAEPAIEKDRITAMGAAMFSLGERIAGELRIGDLRYSIIAGAESLLLMTVLDKDYSLALGLRRDMSVDSVLGELRQAVTPLLRVLKIENLGEDTRT